MDWLAVGVLTTALLGWGALVALPACAADTTTDIGTLDKETAERTHQKPLTRLTRAGTSPRARSSATPTPTPRSRWTRERSVPASARGMPIASPRARRVTASSGQRAKLSRPLDFLVVADHSDNMGFFPDSLCG